MARRASETPTDGELAILRVLWDQGPGTVREVHRAILRRRKTGYTTTLKLMQIMLAKGLLRRDESARPQVYEPTVSRSQAQRQFVGDLLERVFEGSASQFVQQVLSTKPASREELAEIRRLLRDFGEKKR